jgi:hypothetical protein
MQSTYCLAIVVVQKMAGKSFRGFFWGRIRIRRISETFLPDYTGSDICSGILHGAGFREDAAGFARARGGAGFFMEIPFHHADPGESFSLHLRCPGGRPLR